MVGEPRAREGEVSGGHGGRGDGERDPFGIWKVEERRKYVSPTCLWPACGFAYYALITAEGRKGLQAIEDIKSAEVAEISLRVPA